jgi:three-Cys-motif partner protein
MAKQTQQQLFGGSWTQEKLDLLNKYLRAYTRIFRSNPKASFYETAYVDAFAGTGTLAIADVLHEQVMFPELLEGVEEYQKGSVRRALEVDPEFDHYIFIEKDKKRFIELNEIRKEFPNRDIQVRNEEANKFLQRWCEKFDGRKSRAVVFLDPFGTDVNWKTIGMIARTKAVDLWLLFPLFAVNRMLIKDRKPPKAWRDRLTQIFGTPDWETEFYTRLEDQSWLAGFENAELIEKIADTKKIAGFLMRRLKQEFVDAAEPLVLNNSRNSPLYLFCFAAGNQKAATTGLKIAKDILGQ